MHQVSTGKPPGIIEAFVNIYKHDGFTGFFRGHGVALMKIAPEMAIKLFAFDTIKRMFAEDDSQVTPLQRFVSGGLAGMVCHMTSFPLEGLFRVLLLQLIQQ